MNKTIIAILKDMKISIPEMLVVEADSTPIMEVIITPQDTFYLEDGSDDFYKFLHGFVRVEEYNQNVYERVVKNSYQNYIREYGKELQKNKNIDQRYLEMKKCIIELRKENKKLVKERQERLDEIEQLKSCIQGLEGERQKLKHKMISLQDVLDKYKAAGITEEKVNTAYHTQDIVSTFFKMLLESEIEARRYL